MFGGGQTDWWGGGHGPPGPYGSYGPDYTTLNLASRVQPQRGQVLLSRDVWDDDVAFCQDAQARAQLFDTHVAALEQSWLSYGKRAAAV